MLKNKPLVVAALVLIAIVVSAGSGLIIGATARLLGPGEGRAAALREGAMALAANIAREAARHLVWQVQASTGR